MSRDPQVQEEITAAMARAPQNLNGVKFAPWVGNNYIKGGMYQKRILVLGESAYAWDEKEIVGPDLTCWCVAEQVVSMTYRYRFWTGIAMAFLGESPNLTQRRAFWHSIAFSNYVQQIVGVGARVRPTCAMWKASELGFQSVLDALQPELVIVLGKQMWSWLPCEDVPAHEETIAGQTIDLCLYRSGANKMATTVSLPHPSSIGFSGSTWFPVVSELIKIQPL